MDSEELIEKNEYIKIVLLGESQVGKTSIINRYVEKHFQEEYKPTMPCSLYEKRLVYENEIVCLNIWDSIGIEKYKSLNKLFMRKAKGFIFVYDITNKESFDKLKYWVEEAKDVEGDFISIIFGNKSDLFTEEVITEKEGEELARELNANFYLVSAKNNTNIEEGFNYLIEKILKSDLLEKKYTIQIQRVRETEKRRRNGGCCVPKQRKLSNRERCLTCCGYYACKDCLKTGRQDCSNCFCGEKKCTKETCEKCCDYTFCWPCYCCLLFNATHGLGGGNPFCCCCHCPKEGAVSVYGE